MVKDTLTPTIGVAGETSGYILAPAADDGGPGETIGFGDRAFNVHLLDRHVANDLICANHYSRRVYRGSTLHLGVYMSGELVGVLQYGFAMNPASAGSVVAGTLMNEYLELNRMWLADAAPRNLESRALAASIRLIRRLRPAVKWIQSFADECCGLFGTVYQAAGFTFHGEHKGHLLGDRRASSTTTAWSRGGRTLAARAHRSRWRTCTARPGTSCGSSATCVFSRCASPGLPVPGAAVPEAGLRSRIGSGLIYNRLLARGDHGRRQRLSRGLRAGF